MLLGVLDPSGLQQLRSDSQGTSALREGLAGVSLGSGHWQVHQHHLQGQDMHMHDDCPSMQQLQEVGAGSACAEQQVVDTQEQHLMQQQQSPCAEFDSADTAAAAATFEAQLAACCGNRDSQEAVFRAWLDALLPNQGDQQAQQPAQQGDGSPLAQHSGQEGQQAPASPPEFEGMYQQQQQGEVDAHQQPSLVADLTAEFDYDVDAAAAALHLAAQRAVEQGVGDEGGDALNPEEDFRELLDLLLDA